MLQMASSKDLYIDFLHHLLLPIANLIEDQTQLPHPKRNQRQIHIRQKAPHPDSHRPVLSYQYCRQANPTRRALDRLLFIHTRTTRIQDICGVVAKEDEELRGHGQ